MANTVQRVGEITRCLDVVAVGGSSNCLTVGEEEIVQGVYKGTLGSHLVSIRRNPRSADSEDSARVESVLHKLCDDGLSCHVLRCHGFRDEADYAYVCFERFECSLPQVVTYSVGTVLVPRFYRDTSVVMMRYGKLISPLHMECNLCVKHLHSF